MARKKLPITGAVPASEVEPETESDKTSAVGLFDDTADCPIPVGSEVIAMAGLVPIKKMAVGQVFLGRYLDVTGTLGGKPAKNPLLKMEKKDGSTWLMPLTGSILAAMGIERVAKDAEATADKVREKLEEKVGRWLRLEFRGMHKSAGGKQPFYDFAPAWLPEDWAPAGWVAPTGNGKKKS